MIELVGEFVIEDTMDIVIYQAGISLDEFVPGLLVPFDASLDKFQVIQYAMKNWKY